MINAGDMLSSPSTSCLVQARQERWFGLWRIRKKLLELIKAIPRHGDVFFSQEGEDMLLRRHFGGKECGFYVDVGAHDPCRFSNTYWFYRRGWRGINIDPLPGVMVSFAKLRPRDINLELAMSSHSQNLTYYMFNEPALNTFDPLLAHNRDGKQGNRIVSENVLVTRSLKSVFGEYLPEGQRIDFLTVDVEGCDLDVLRSNDWTVYRPEVVLAEDVNAVDIKQALEGNVTLYMANVGYVLVAKTVNTLFYRDASVRT